jgi:uncharacterized membrane protein
LVKLLEVPMARESRLQAKRPVSASLAGPYGPPPHPILATVPIGAWGASPVFDIASHVAQRPGPFTQGSRWLIAVGVIGALPAAVVGFLDLSAVPAGTPASRTALAHMTLNLLVTAAYTGNFLWRYSDHTGGGSAGVGELVLSALSLAALGVLGFPGGKLTYRYGVRVADEGIQAEGYTPGRSAQGVRSVVRPGPRA